MTYSVNTDSFFNCRESAVYIDSDELYPVNSTLTYFHLLTDTTFSILGKQVLMDAQLDGVRGAITISADYFSSLGSMTYDNSRIKITANEINVSIVRLTNVSTALIEANIMTISDSIRSNSGSILTIDASNVSNGVISTVSASSFTNIRNADELTFTVTNICNCSINIENWDVNSAIVPLVDLVGAGATIIINAGNINTNRTIISNNSASINTIVFDAKNVVHTTSRMITSNGNGNYSFNIDRLTSSVVADTGILVLGSGINSITGGNWVTSSTLTPSYISVSGTSANISVDIKNVLFSTTGSGAFINSSGTINCEIGEINSSSTTSGGIIIVSAGVARVSIDQLTSAAIGYRVEAGASLYLSTIRSVNNGTNPVVRITGTTLAPRLEMTGVYTASSANAVITDNGTAVMSLIGCKLNSTADGILKSTAGLMNVFSAGSIARVGVNALRITIQGSLLVNALLPA
jgi:hypothetical protein